MKSRFLLWRVLAIVILLIVVSASFMKVASADGPIRSGSYESVVKTNYGYKYTLSANQARALALAMKVSSGVCDLLRNPWMKFGCKIPQWLKFTATADQVLKANRSGRGVYFGVAMAGPFIVGTAVAPR